VIKANDVAPDAASEQSKDSAAIKWFLLRKCDDFVLTQAGQVRRIANAIRSERGRLFQFFWNNSGRANTNSGESRSCAAFCTLFVPSVHCSRRPSVSKVCVH
jgi:hypothetical protein